MDKRQGAEDVVWLEERWRRAYAAWLDAKALASRALEWHQETYDALLKAKAAEAKARHSDGSDHG